VSRGIHFVGCEYSGVACSCGFDAVHAAPQLIATIEDRGELFSDAGNHGAALLLAM
jgi:hypothetical protein